MSVKEQTNTKRQRGGRLGRVRSLKSLNFPPLFPSFLYRVFFPLHLSVTLQFRHQAHVSRTDVIYQGLLLRQPTHLCPPLATPVPEPHFQAFNIQSHKTSSDSQTKSIQAYVKKHVETHRRNEESVNYFMKSNILVRCHCGKLILW